MKEKLVHFCRVQSVLNHRITSGLDNYAVAEAVGGVISEGRELGSAEVDVEAILRVVDDRRGRNRFDFDRNDAIGAVDRIVGVIEVEKRIHFGEEDFTGGFEFRRVEIHLRVGDDPRGGLDDEVVVVVGVTRAVGGRVVVIVVVVVGARAGTGGGGEEVEGGGGVGCGGADEGVSGVEERLDGHAVVALG